jgi:hypothetical protein
VLGLTALQTAFGEDWRNPRNLHDAANLFLESAILEHHEIAGEFMSEVK